MGESAFGAILTWNGERLLELESITGPSYAVDTIDVTSHDSENGFREFVAGLGDGGDITFEGNLLPGDDEGQMNFLRDLGAKEEREVTVSSPDDGIVFTCQGIATGWTPSFPHDGKLGFSATIKVTGKPSFATNVYEGTV